MLTPKELVPLMYLRRTQNPRVVVMLKIDEATKNGIVDNGNEGIKIKTWPHEVGNLSIKIFKLRDNSRNAFKSIKIQNVI